MHEESKKTKAIKCALVIGHSINSKGAKNRTYNLTEFDFNITLAEKIRLELDNQTEVITEVIYRDKYRDLPGKINSCNPDFIISLHCNAFNEKASGTETLYYHTSLPGRKLASLLQRSIISELLLPDRGIKPKSSEDRGGYLLKYTNAPCIIAEPFFIDNDTDMEKATYNLNGLAHAYAIAIKEMRKLLWTTK